MPAPVFKYDPKKVHFTGEDFVVYNIIDELPKHPNYPYGSAVKKPDGRRAIYILSRYGLRTKPITQVFVHQTAGGYAPGFRGAYNTAAFITRDPEYDTNGRWTGRGRGWPAMCYSYYFPYEPERQPHTGKFIIFRCVPDERISWHTKGHNENAISLGFQGLFSSRHARVGTRHPNSTNGGHPSAQQMTLLNQSWDAYFKPTFNLTDSDIFGHFEAVRSPKLSCPGDALERWVLATRREVVQMRDWHTRQAALVLLGYDLGAYGPHNNGVDGIPGYRTRAAIENIEGENPINCNGETGGVWTDTIGRLVLCALHEAGHTMTDINNVIDGREPRAT